MKSWLLLLLGILIFVSASAQTETDPTKLKKILPELNIAQKQQVLAYARQFKELDLDDAISKIFANLSPQEKKFVLEYAKLKLQPNAQINADSAETAAILTSVSWDKTTFDFGEMEEGKIYSGEFVVTNIGSNPLVFSGAKSRCDCTVADYPHTPIAVGASATVRVEFNSSKKLGQLQQGIVLYDNSDPNLRSILYIKGEVKAKQ